MFGIDSSELLVIVIIAVIVIGPKDLPRALYKVGQIVGKAQGMARHFRTGLDAMVREVELEELEKKWAAQNKRIMAEHPPEMVASPVAPALASPPAPASSPAMEALPSPAADGPPYLADTPGEKPPFVAEPASVASSPGDAPPYIAGQAAADGKGDAAA